MGRKKKKGGGGYLVVGAAFLLWVGGCLKTDIKKNSPLPASGFASEDKMQQTTLPLLGEPALPRSAPRTLIAADGSEIRNVAVWHPKAVKLVKAAKLRNGGLVASEAPTGTELLLLGIDGDQLFVEYRGQTQKIPAPYTDLAAQMAAVQAFE